MQLTDKRPCVSLHSFVILNPGQWIRPTEKPTKISVLVDIFPICWFTLLTMASSRFCGCVLCGTPITIMLVLVHMDGAVSARNGP